MGNLNIEELLAKYLDNECSEDERSYVNRWITENPQNLKVFSEIRETWLLTKFYDESFNPDTNSAWKSVQAKISKRKKQSYKIYYRAAAILFISVSLYFAYYLLPFSKGSNMIEFANNTDDLQTIELPDGSKAWLSKGSNISYKQNFEGNEREVKLDGEAFFDVTKNPDKPFIVTGNKTIVKVLGTSFIYRTYNFETVDKLIVNTGKVSFAEKKNVNNKILVDPGYEANFESETCILKKLQKDNKAFFALKTGRLIFENERFEDILIKLSGFYQRKYFVKDQKLNDIRLTIAFNNQSIGEALNLLEAVLDRKITDTSMTIVIY